MSRLSVVIITLNEEENIGKCIDSVKDIADEIIVVDSFSTDRTAVIAKEKGAKVIPHKFEGHIQQKNWAKDQASFNYVLSLDADEYVSGQLKLSIQKAKKNFEADGYYINRLNFYCGHPIRTCGWYPDAKLRLWKRTLGKWKGTNPHDRFELNEEDNIDYLQGDILHNTYPTFQSFIDQKEKFANISAQQLKSRSVIFLALKLIFSPIFKFTRMYIIKQGFTEGGVGWSICYYQSREVFLKYFRAIKLKYS